jgi:hypothetical protein
MVQPVPADNSGTHDLPVRELSAEAATYDGAVARLRELVDDGERIITLRGPRVYRKSPAAPGFSL